MISIDWRRFCLVHTAGVQVCHPDPRQDTHLVHEHTAALGQKVTLGITSQVPQKLKGNRGSAKQTGSLFFPPKVFVSSKNVKECI